MHDVLFVFYQVAFLSQCGMPSEKYVTGQAEESSSVLFVLTCYILYVKIKIP